MSSDDNSTAPNVSYGFLMQWLLCGRFSIQFIGEETTATYGATELTDEPTWIVDPLDGTTNFVHG